MQQAFSQENTQLPRCNLKSNLTSGQFIARNTLPVKSFKYVFVDESGDLGEHGSKCFVIACLSTLDPKPIERIIKKVRERKIEKRFRDVPELKANSSSPEIRRGVLSRLATCDCEINIVVIDKQSIKSYLYDVKNKLYNYIFGLLIDDMSLSETSLEIIIDKRDSNRLLRDDLDQYLYGKLAKTLNPSKIKINHVESHHSKALQVTDFVAWSVNRKHSFDDDSYYKIIESKIKKPLDLWKQ